MLSEKEYERELKRLKKLNEQRERQIQLEAERNKYRPHVETNKIMAVYLFALLNAIIIYAMTAMWVFRDLTYLGVLISDIAAQVLIYAIYCLKAYHAKKQSEKIKFDRDKLKGTLGDVLDAGSQSNEHVPLTKGSIELPQEYYEQEVDQYE